MLERRPQGRLRRGSTAAAVIISSLLASCAADDPVPAPLDAVVGIRASGCGLAEHIGTGVAIESEGATVIVTSAHTVAGADQIKVLTTDDETIVVDLVALDPASDVALLTTAGTRTATLSSTISVGDGGTLATWHPADGFQQAEISVTRRLLVTIEDIFGEDDVERRAFEIDQSVRAGNSGGPVFDKRGNVLGIVYAASRERDAAFAVRFEELTDLLDAPLIPDAAMRCP